MHYSNSYDTSCDALPPPLGRVRRAFARPAVFSYTGISGAAYRAQLPLIFWQAFLGPLAGRSYRQFSGRRFCGPLTGRSYRQFSFGRLCGPPTGRSYHQFSGRRFVGRLQGAATANLLAGGSAGAQTRYLGAPEAPFWHPGGSLGCSRGHRGHPTGDLGVQTWILVDFGWILGAFWDHLGVILVTFS